MIKKMVNSISFAVIDFYNKVCKVLGVRNTDTYQYDDPPSPFTKDMVLHFESSIWPLVDNTNNDHVRFQFNNHNVVLPEVILKGFTVDCIESQYHLIHQTTENLNDYYPIFDASIPSNQT